MRFEARWTLALLCAPAVLATTPLWGISRVSLNLPTAIPNRYIIEIDNIGITSNGSFIRPLDAICMSLRSRGVSFAVTREFNSPGLFVGAALTVEDIVVLQSIPEITAIRPVVKIYSPEPIARKVVKDPNDSSVPPDTQSTHVITGVDKLHAQGIAGKGIKIGIIDTGVDYTHPSLGGGFGPGYKVAGGADLVGDDYNGSNEPIPDSDPIDQCRGHGTHVAGIVGANPGNGFNISGVAPDAIILAYRVFGCAGSATDDILIEALLRGVQDGNDILSLSIVGADGWTESSSSVVASRIAATGKIVTIAAGNDGSSGSWYSSGPGNAIDGISVASLDSPVVPLQKAIVHGPEHEPIIYFSTLPLAIQNALPVYATSTSPTVPDDACDPLPDSTPDLSDFLVVIRRGTCTFAQKLTNTERKGGKFFLIYDNGTGFAGVSVGSFTAALIRAADGEFLVRQFAAGVPVTISFPQVGGSVEFPNPSGGLISSFSTYGPTNDFFFKPTVAAPGGSILSTLPHGSFGLMSGTSMSTPFVAGAAALLLSVKGTSASVGRSARTLFETTAQLVPSSHQDSDPLQTVAQQGAGLIDAFNAIRTTTIVAPGELILNDSAHFDSVQSFTVENTGPESKSFVVTHLPAGTALTMKPGTIFAATGPVPLSPIAASVRIDPTQFVLQPGQTQTVVATFTPPAGLDPTTLPVFSGFINIAAPSENLHVTYIGSVGSLRDRKVLDDTDLFFPSVKLPAVLDPDRYVQTNPRNYTFVGGDVPTILWRQAFGTPVFRADLVDPSFAMDVTAPNHAVIGTLLEKQYLTRNNEDDDNGYNIFVIASPSFSNGTNIPNGSYRILLRALKVTGDRSKEEDYESWLGPIVGVQRSS